jgi:hypothetical protein
MTAIAASPRCTAGLACRWSPISFVGAGQFASPHPPRTLVAVLTNVPLDHQSKLPQRARCSIDSFDARRAHNHRPAAPAKSP